MDPYLLLAAAEGTGPGLIPPLLDPFSAPDDLLDAPPPGTPPAARRRCRNRRELEATVMRWLDDSERLGIEVLSPADTTYPERLRDAPLRPAVLFARGNLDLLRGDNTSIAVVGSRTPTAYGQAAAHDFASALASQGVVLWSGLATGIDATAHRASLGANTPTVAVVAGGLDSVYPAAHTGLLEKILDAGGLCVSELPPGVRPQRGHFPRRNRILALCVQGVLVIEAGMASGSLHTAQFGADAGVPVLAVPGPYTSQRSRGCHRLLAEGALVAADPETVLRDLDLLVATREQPAAAADATTPSPSQHELFGGRHGMRPADEQAILALLSEGPRPCELVRRECRLEDTRFLIALENLLDRQKIRELEGDLLAIHQTHDGRQG